MIAAVAVTAWLPKSDPILAFEPEGVIQRGHFDVELIARQSVPDGEIYGAPSEGARRKSGPIHAYWQSIQKAEKAAMLGYQLHSYWHGRE